MRQCVLARLLGQRHSSLLDGRGVCDFGAEAEQRAAHLRLELRERNVQSRVQRVAAHDLTVARGQNHAASAAHTNTGANRGEAG